MPEREQMQKLVEEVNRLREAATEVKKLSGDFEAVGRNIDRVLAGIRMLELNVSEPAEVLGDQF